ncbi:MAG: hypothetical protein FMNOHCHN_00344 [Ignavibacteriaceae bacterium]|nr:hypothetical protein [Ignavibacteriaceae bacterium]
MAQKKIVVVWGNIPTYISRSIEEILVTGKYQILVIEQVPSNYSNQIFRFNLDNENLEYVNMTLHHYDRVKVEQKLNEFLPDLLIAPLTIKDDFAEIVKCAHRNGCITIGCTDHYFKGLTKEWKRYLRMRFRSFSHFDFFWVPGYRALTTLITYGFQRKMIFSGLYSCDSKTFQSIGKSRSYDHSSWPRKFIFVGNYSSLKGIDTLVKAYQIYKNKSRCAWSLITVGYGEMEELLNNEKGIVNMGGKKQSEIANLMMESGCFILPSRSDHWPLVIHEASSSGLPILASSSCGNVVELVQENFNGFIFEPDDYRSLANYMLRIEEVGNEMGERSSNLAKRLDSTNWIRVVSQVLETE